MAKISNGKAYLIAGGAGILPTLFEYLTKESLPIPGNPDFFLRTYAHFGIDEANDIAARSSLRAVSGGVRTFIVVTPSLTIEAQNALLKTLEEPAADAVFFFVVSAPDALLPTLRSRTTTIALKGAAEPVVDADRFLSAAYAKRLDMLKPLLPKKSGDEEGSGGRDVGQALAFLAALERRVHALPVSEPGRSEGARAILRARAYLTDKGSMMKMLLEHVALLVPAARPGTNRPTSS